MRKMNVKRKGFTLIELIVVIALIGIVSSMLWSFFGYNQKLYKKSETLAQVQFDVRMATDYIDSVIRNIEELDIRDSTDVQQISGGVTIDSSTLQAKYSNVQSVSFLLELENGNYLLTSTIKGVSTNGNEDFELTSTTLINNSKNIVLHSTGNIGVSKNAIDYKK